MAILSFACPLQILKGTPRSMRTHDVLFLVTLSVSFRLSIFPWSALADELPVVEYSHLAHRMGLAPGCIANISVQIPVQRRLAYGYASDQSENIQDLTSLLLGKANHTGSDIRITTGQVMVPRAFPRQSASADWWNWKVNFTCHWKQKEHINALELRSIILALQWRVRHLGNVRLQTPAFDR